METTIKNTFWFRHFLICNRLAQVNCISGGEGANFAKYIYEEENEGRVFNSQMTRYFWFADEVISDIHLDESRSVFEMIGEEQDIYLEQLAELTAEQLEDYYEQYVIGKVFKSTQPTSQEIVDEMDTDMEDSGLAQGEIVSLTNHWKNKYIITKKD